MDREWVGAEVRSSRCLLAASGNAAANCLLNVARRSTSTTTTTTGPTARWPLPHRYEPCLNPSNQPGWNASGYVAGTRLGGILREYRHAA